MLWTMNGKNYKYEASMGEDGRVLLLAEAKNGAGIVGSEFPTLDRAIKVARLMD